MEGGGDSTRHALREMNSNLNLDFMRSDAFDLPYSDSIFTVISKSY